MANAALPCWRSIKSAAIKKLLRVFAGASPRETALFDDFSFGFVEVSANDLSVFIRVSKPITPEIEAKLSNKKTLLLNIFHILTC